MEKLKPGDKYLSIKLVGHNFIRAFKNKNKTDNQPDFKGDGVSVWISVFKPKEETNVVKTNEEFIK